MNGKGMARTIHEIEKEYNDPAAWLLGCILYDQRCLTGLDGGPVLLDLLLPTHFFDIKHAAIFEAMLSLNQKTIEISNVSVFDELGKLGKQDAGDSVLLTKLLMLVMGQDTIIHRYWEAYGGFAKIVLDDWRERSLLGLAGDVATAAKAHDTTTLEILQGKLDHTIHVGSKDGQGLMVEQDDGLLDELEAWYNDPREVRGYRTGIKELDRAMGGFLENELMILAGYTGSGKSTMVMQFALSFADQGSGLIIPTEMDVRQWKLRLIAYLLGTDDRTIRSGQYRDLVQLKEVARYVNEGLPITWFKGAAPTPAQILTSARNLHRNRLADWVIVDGLHDIRAEGDGIYERTNAAIDCLHEMAALGLRVVATAHVNRGAIEEPNIRDLLATSRIEQVATRILTLYRPGNLMESGELRHLPEGISPNMAQLRLAKSRFSEAGKVIKLMFGKQNDGPHGFSPVTDPDRYSIPPDYRMKDGD